jgi:N-acetylmuramoyl-L-alanine amidase
MRPLVTCIDAGHGGHDSGALAPDGSKESDYALDVANRTRGILIKHISVVMTRVSDVFQTLGQRGVICNNAKCDSFVSIHFNSAKSKTSTGREIFTTRGQNNSDKLADKIEFHNARLFPNQRTRRDMRDGDIDKEAGFKVIRQAACPAVLVEGEFIHNAKGAAWIANESNRQKMGEAIAYGILDFHGVAYQLMPTTPDLKPTAKTIEERVARIEKYLDFKLP